MALPKSVKVGLHKFKIIIENLNLKKKAKTLDAKHKHFEPLLYGETSLRSLEVRIEKTCKPSMKFEVLFHELGHCLVDQTAMADFLTSREEEIIVQNFGVYFLNIIKDNPGLIRAIQKYYKTEE